MAAYYAAIISVRLTCEAFYVDLRLVELNGRFIAPADTPDGPTLGIGWGAVDAITNALVPFDGVIDELFDSLPDRSR